VRILHLADRLTDRGGAYWHLLGVLDALVTLDHAVHLVVGADEGRIEAPCPVSVAPGLEARTRVRVDLSAIAASFRPDVIHLHTVVNPAVLEWASGFPALITVQDHRYFCPTRGKWTAAGAVCREAMGPMTCAACFTDQAYFREVLALTEERLAALGRLPIVVLSRYMKGELALVGVDAGRVAVIPPFVHGLDGGAEPDGPPCVLFVGRLTGMKGVDDAVRAWRGARIDAPLVFAGTGPERERLQGEGAQVLGWIGRPALSSLYRRARALVMPSRWQEPFGIAGLEALSLGTPVVAWASGGIPEWHPGPGLVAWGDVDGLSRVLGEACGRRAEAPPGFARDRLMERLLGLYAAVAGGRQDTGLPRGSTFLT
jgi:glycosyltransferase involved in cell wall biosynthesis